MKSRKKVYVIVILIVLLLAFIWGHSMMNGTDSRAESEAVRRTVTPFLELFFGRGGVSERAVRKLAHFAEYFCLGTLGALLLEALDRHSIFYYSYALMAGLAAAVADESIQLASAGRSAQVADILLDFCALLLGALAAAAIAALCRRRHK